MTLDSNPSEEQNLKKQAAKQTVERFVAAYEESYRVLAYYAALPLLLTPELLNYLRNRFLRGQTPWVAEIDLLLDGEMCRSVDYELYAMQPDVRAHLLAEMHVKLGDGVMQQVARTLIHYVRHLAQTNTFLDSHELQAQQWAAMVYLDDQRSTAVRELAESFHNAARLSTAPGTVDIVADRAELARLTRLTATFAPALAQHQALVEYAYVVSQLLTGVGDLPQGVDANYRATVEGVALRLPNNLMPVTSMPGESTPGDAKVDLDSSPSVETHYLNFDLQIEEVDDATFRTRVLSSPAGEAQTIFEFPYTNAELEFFFLQIRVSSMSSSPKNPKPETKSRKENAVKEFGTTLYNAVFQRDVETSLRHSMAEAERQGAGLRLRLILRPSLMKLPWEYLYDPLLERFLALSTNVSIVRYRELPRSVQPLLITSPLKVLVMLSSPQDREAIDIESEWKRIEEAFAKLRQQEMIQVTRLFETTLRGLQDRLVNEQYHIFHFSGHAAFDERLQEGFLYLEDESGRTQSVSGDNLGLILGSHPSLRMVLLNAGESARVSAGAPFTSIAQQLMQQGIPAVVAMQSEITDRAAISFTHEFYTSLADGYSVDRALTQARRSLFLAEQDFEWGTPVLNMSGSNGRLFIQADSHVDGAQSVVSKQTPIEFDWVPIAAGEFLLGSNKQQDILAYDNETPQQKVYLAEYRIARTPVTNAQYSMFVEATKHEAPRHWKNSVIPKGKENHPVVYVSWQDAQAFCQWAGVRLPSEAEWEKAARGSDARIWPWGNEPPTDKHCNFNANIGDTTPVDQYPHGASPYGLLDMAGNAWEWTSSLYKLYPYKTGDERENIAASGAYTLSGGSWFNSESDLRCVSRDNGNPVCRLYFVGFRVVSLGF